MNGKLCWISSDILSLVESDLEDGLSVSQALRPRLGLPEREPLNKKKPPKQRQPRWKFPVYDLDIGVMRIFKYSEFQSWNSVSQSVMRQRKRYNMDFEICWHEQGIRVRRVK